MSGGSQKQTSQSTSQNSLPSWLQQPFQTALGTNTNLLNQGLAATGGGTQLLGSGLNQIAGVNPTSIGAADTSLSNILGGNFLNGAQSTFNAANPQIAAEASGALMNPASNPYLQSAYNRGLQGIQNNVDSQFGAAGRNVLAGAPIQADQASQLATNLYGGAYNTNLQAMQNAQQLASGNYNTGVSQIGSAAATAPGVTSGLYTPGQQQLSAGQTPFNLSSWYQNLLGQTAAPFGQNTSTGTSTVQNNPGGLATFGGIMSGIGGLLGGIGAL